MNESDSSNSVKSSTITEDAVEQNLLAVVSLIANHFLELKSVCAIDIKTAVEAYLAFKNRFPAPRVSSRWDEPNVALLTEVTSSVAKKDSLA